MTELRRCSRCTIPETHETIVFDDQGVCNVCRGHEFKKESIDWTAREEEFAALIEQSRGKYSHDCIIPFSGGKDSTYTLYHMITKYKVKPLVVQFDHGFLRQRMLENNVRTLKKMGCDFLSFRPNWRVVRKLMLESLKRKGDFCWHCHTGIYSYPMQIAVKFQIPLLVWGEPSAEYTSYYGYDEQEEVDEKRFNRWVNLGITADDMVGMIDGVEPRELDPFRYPTYKELRKLGVRSVCLGSYYPWDVKTQSEIIERELGWQGNEVEGVPPEYQYEKIECYMQGVRDYLKFLKRGYGRTAHLTSIDIRNGRLAREEAMRMLQEFDGKRPPSLDLFLDFVGIDEEEFLDLAVSHIVSPWQPEVAKIPDGRKLHDMGTWDRTIPLTEI
ncbi:MAG TPA: N-acetyl sugar amidotransferase [Vicinamibacterales bacterium]|nr:N-acetyl sugar amidotransferase [Vicinamibacterales bacterium]